MTSKGVLCCVKHRNVIYQDLSLTHYQATYTQAGLVYEGKPRTKSSTRHCGISFCRFVVTTPQIQVSLCRFRLSLRHRYVFSSLYLHYGNIQQILNGVNNNLMEEKDGINYLCATIDRLLDIINRKRKSKADQTLYGIYIILSNISKGTAFLHRGVTNCGFRKLGRYNLNRKSL